MAIMFIYGKNLKNRFSRTNMSMTLKLGMKHCVYKYFQDCSNYDRWLTLIYFEPRSKLVTRAFAWAKVKIMHYLENVAVICLKVGLMLD